MSEQQQDGARPHGGVQNDDGEAAALPEQPDKTIEELAREQGLLDRPPPDYPALIGALFEDEEEAREFREYIAELRGKPPPDESS